MCSCWALNQEVTKVLICDIFLLLSRFLFAAAVSCIAAKINATMDCGTFFILQVDLGMQLKYCQKLDFEAGQIKSPNIINKKKSDGP